MNNNEKPLNIAMIGAGIFKKVKDAYFIAINNRNPVKMPYR